MGNRSTFLSTPSARRATSSLVPSFFSITYFYPRLPRGGRLSVPRDFSKVKSISIHTLREEGDRRVLLTLFMSVQNQSLPSGTNSSRSAGWQSKTVHSLSRTSSGICLTELLFMPDRVGWRIPVIATKSFCLMPFSASTAFNLMRII